MNDEPPISEPMTKAVIGPDAREPFIQRLRTAVATLDEGLRMLDDLDDTVLSVAAAHASQGLEMARAHLESIQNGAASAAGLRAKIS